MTDVPANLIPGAEPTTWEGGPIGVLVLHGFTGNPGSMRGLAEHPELHLREQPRA